MYKLSSGLRALLQKLKFVILFPSFTLQYPPPKPVLSSHMKEFHIQSHFSSQRLPSFTTVEILLSWTFLQLDTAWGSPSQVMTCWSLTQSVVTDRLGSAECNWYVAVVARISRDHNPNRMVQYPASGVQWCEQWRVPSSRGSGSYVGQDLGWYCGFCS